MKKLLMATVLMPLLALADIWTDPNTGITWEFDSYADGSVCLGSMYYGRYVRTISTTTEGDVVIPSRIKGMPVVSVGSGAFSGCELITSLIIPEGVSSVLDCAFAGCIRLRSVSIPATLTYIGQIAFAGCDALKSVDIKDLASWCKIVRDGGGSQLVAEGLFLNGEKVTNLRVPDGVEMIRDHAFESILGLKTVVIPASVTNIGYRAFCCADLEFVCFEGNAPANAGLIYGEYNDDITITYVREESTGWGAVPDKWCRCPIETWTNYPDEPWTSAITEVDGLKWQYYAHGGDAIVLRCLDAKGDLVIPEFLGGHKVVAIADEAFSDCSLITSVKMPESVVRIGEKAFRNCVALTSVSIPTGVTWIRDETFLGCRGLESVQITGSVVCVGNFAFYGCRGLKSLTLPESGTSIGCSAFSGCDGLTSVTIPDGVRCVAARAFEGCGLKSVTLPASVISIGECAFNLNSIETVYVKDLAAFGRIDFADDASNPVFENVKLYADGKLVTETVKVTFAFDDNWIAAFPDESSGWGYVIEKTLEVGVGHHAWPPEVVVLDGRFEIRDWDCDLKCVMRDAVVHPTYGGAEINEAMSLYGEGGIASQCSVDCAVYDSSSKCVRVHGMLDTTDSPLCYLDDTWSYGQLDERLYGNLRIRLIGRDENGREVCYVDTSRMDMSTTQFSWSGALPIDTNEVRQVEIALVSTWYRGERCLIQMPISEIDREYVITYADTKGVVNPNPLTYMATNEIVFAVLADTDEYWFRGWEPAKIEVGTTGDLVVTAKWERIQPAIKGDEGATVTGDAETGFVVKPSEGKTAVEVTIPQGMDAAKVTVEVSPKVASVKPNGATVKIVSGGADITEFLNEPTADGSGVIDLTKATVKEEIVKEAMDVEKGAKIELDATNPSLTTSNTRVGLFYQLREGVTIEGMVNGDSIIGNGQPWSPEIKVKGGNSAFYSIDVGKGE